MLVGTEERDVAQFQVASIRRWRAVPARRGGTHRTGHSRAGERQETATRIAAKASRIVRHRRSLHGVQRRRQATRCARIIVACLRPRKSKPVSCESIPFVFVDSAVRLQLFGGYRSPRLPGPTARCPFDQSLVCLNSQENGRTGRSPGLIVVVRIHTILTELNMIGGHDIAMDLRAAYWSMHRTADALLQPHGVTANQFVLRSILAEDKALTQQELVRRASSDANTVRAMLMLLERSGRVFRRPLQAADQARCLALTNKPRRTYNALWTKSQAFHNRLLAAIGPECGTCLHPAASIVGEHAHG